jgi:hypothetical protein
MQKKKEMEMELSREQVLLPQMASRQQKKEKDTELSRE